MSAKCQFRKSTRSLEEDVPDRDARIAEVPIGIEHQVHDPMFVSKNVGGHRLTIDKVFSGPTAIRDIRQSANL